MPGSGASGSELRVGDRVLSIDGEEVPEDTLFTDHLVPAKAAYRFRVERNQQGVVAQL